MERSVSISSSPMAGVPASISGTPAAASASAISIFSLRVKATPGACSPSRSVVSLRKTVRVAAAPFAEPPASAEARPERPDVTDGDFASMVSSSSPVALRPWC